MALTRRQATKAGRILQESRPDSPEYQEALETMRQWRGQHVEPTQESFRRLLEVSQAIPESVASYRLKRQVSILAKLGRGGNTFELGAIDDLGGCRIILNDMDQVEAACAMIRGRFPDISRKRTT